MTTPRTTTIGELIGDGTLEMSDGYRTKRSELGTPGFRIIRVADVGEGTISLDGPDFVSENRRSQIGSKLGQPGDVLLTTKGTVGRVAVLPALAHPVVYSPQVCFFRIRNESTLDSRYLRYWFGSPDFWRQASDRMNNTDMAAYVNLADIRSLKLGLPTIQEQRAIAEVLGALDDKIAANASLSAAAENVALTIALGAESTVPLGSVVTYHKVQTDPSASTALRVAHFSLPAFDSGRIAEVVSPTQIKSSKFAVEQPSVLVSKLNPRFPRVWDVPELPSIPALASTEFLVLVPKFSSSTFLWALLLQPSFGSALESKVSGTSGSHQRVRPDDLLATLVPDPRAFDDVVKDRVTSLGLRAIQARRESTQLAATRDALIPALMSKRLRVRDAERIVEDVA